MAKPERITPYVQEALREKAERDLTALDLRVEALDGIDRALDTLSALATSLAHATPAIAQTASDPGVVTRLKKLRRAVDEAKALAEEISTSVDVPTARTAATDARASILDALVSAGIDPAVFRTGFDKGLSPGGEAE